MSNRDPRYFKVYQDGDDRELEQKIQQIVESGAAPGIDMQARESIDEIQRMIDNGEIGGGGGGAGVDSKAREDIQKVTTQLADTQTELGKTNSKIVTYEVSSFDVSLLNGKTSEQVITNYFEPLRTLNPNYIKRELLGKDATNTYNIYKYVLAPPNYSKTLFINTAMHGGEVTFLATMYELMKKLSGKENTTNSFINYLKHNVRIIYIPFVNPWGFNQANRTRWNGRGVNIARNSSYNWTNFRGDDAPFKNDYKGTSAFSEIEAQYLKNILDTENIDFYLDLHNTGVGTGLSYYAVVEYKSDIWYPFNRLLNELKTFNKLTGSISLGKSQEPLIPLYATSKGIYASTLEVADGNFGALNSNLEINKSMELLLSVIKNTFDFIDYKRDLTFSIPEIENPMDGISFTWNNTTTPIVCDSADFTELSKFRISYENEPRMNSLVEVEFQFVYLGSSANTIFYLAPNIEYVGNGDTVTIPIGTAFTDVYEEGSGRHTLTCKASAYLRDTYYPVIKFFGKVQNGNATIMRVRGTVTRTRVKNNNLKNVNGTNKETNASGSVFI